jgi:hypothetical protein
LSFIRASVNPLLLLAIYASGRVVVEPTRARAKDQAPLALGLGLFPLYGLFVGIVYPTGNDWLVVPAMASVLALLCLFWLLAALRGAGRHALLVANLFLVAALAGLLVPLLTHMPAYDAVNGTDPTGARGVVRTVAWGIFVYGILRTDMLGVDLRPRTVKRGTIAAAALAALFILAQVMQNFLSAKMGLLTGGVIAGAVLFAANPVQRAIERATSEGGQETAAKGATAEREASFRMAVRWALKDGNVTRDEERGLVVLADQLGIKPARAFELRDQVESDIAQS